MSSIVSMYHISHVVKFEINDLKCDADTQNQNSSSSTRIRIVATVTVNPL